MPQTDGGNDQIAGFGINLNITKNLGHLFRILYQEIKSD
jgi:hypothetical protein